MKVRVMFVVMLLISVVVLSGCQKAETVQTQTTQAEGNSAAVFPGEGGDARNPELDSVSRLTLGTFQLEGSDNAITPEQATKLLPLWKLVQGGTLTRDEETNAVIKQIEGQMTEAQLAAIDAMGLTMDDMMTWMQEQGIEMVAPGSPGDGQSAPEGMTDEEREQMRQRFENMTEEERAAAMAEGGFQRREGAPGGQGAPPEGQAPGDGQPPSGARPGMGGMRGGNMLLEPLITLLTERAAQ